LLKLQISGVYSERAFRRYYPSSEVMSHVLGTTNIDDRGQEGLELAFDQWLVGTPGVKRVIRDRRGQVVENVELIREAQPGRDLNLSIDRRIQYLAYRELMSAIKEHNAQSGSMVILDVTSGEILAMVNLPSFNPNTRSNADPSHRRNRAVTDVVEPGSTMKAFTVTAGLESGKWTPTTPVDMSAGMMMVAGNPVRDIHNYGYGDVTKVITKSSNVGAAKIVLSISNEEFSKVLRGVGFGEITGSGFPGESPGFLPISKSLGAFQKATMAFGYSLSVTPLQLAQAYSVLANHGRLRQPTFLKDNPNPEKQIVEPHVADEMITMMETVISPQGSGLRAAVPNYRVAGKTGTSRRYTKGGYENRYISLFAGIVPASNPRLVGVVVIHDPGSGKGGAYYGGVVSAPVFSKVMDGALRLLNVPPDNVQHWYANAPTSGSPINSNSAAPDYAPDEPNYEEGVPQ
ncbi:MAG: penicillin-binding protein 2, partial [Dokdonella sp.]